MLSGVIASVDKPHRAGGESNDGADPERRPPTVVGHDVSDEQGGEAGARSYTGENPSIRNAALGGRNPARNKLIGRGIDNRFARTEKKADRDQNEKRTCNVRGNHGSERGKNAPPHDARGQHPARSEAVCEPAPYRLEECVTNQHRAEHFAQLHVAEMVGLCD